MQPVRVSLTLLVVVAMSPSLVNAAVIEFTNRAAWLTAAGTVTNSDFEGIAPAGGSKGFAGPLTLSGVQFSSTPLGVSVVSAGLDYVNAWGSGDKLLGGPVEFDITLPAGVTAVGSDIMITSTFFLPIPSGTYTATLSTGDVFTNIFSSAPPTRSFVGFISTSPITSIKLVSSPSLAMIDNFAFKSATSAIPEPGSLPLMYSGLLGIFALLLARGRKTAR
jgi:hypothetical protein